MTGYLYNAEGQRVAKGTISTWSCDPSTNGFTTTNQYTLGLAGEQISEWAVVPGGTDLEWQHSNVWANGQLFATLDHLGTHYYLNDWLGSRRVQTDASGIVENVCSSLPFGDSLNCQQWEEFPTEHHFTGKERDSESGNDYFGARYYASTMGRWLSPDWSAKEEPVPYAKLGDPQTLNLYSYVTNNPLGRADLDGHAGDILVIEDGPTQGNPIGHTAIAITGKGVFSFGNGTPLGSSTTDYLQGQASRRDQTVTVIKTTPEQDQAAYNALMKQNDKGGINVYPDNCSARSNAALDAAGVPTGGPDMTKPGQQSPLPIVPQNPDPSMPGTAGRRAEGVPGSQTTVIPKGSKDIPGNLNQFNPKPGTPPPPPEKKTPQQGSS
jgi:RHS repeat-associated protein